MNTFIELWNQIDDKKKITESGKSVTMTPEQFKKMLRQFYDIGHKHGYKDGHSRGMDSAKELNDIVNKNTNPSDFSDIFNGNFGDIFGGKK